MTIRRISSGPGLPAGFPFSMGSEENGTLLLMSNPFAPDERIRVVATDVTARKPYPLSMMPAGLINSLNEDELKDLVAYVLSGGNPQGPALQPPAAPIFCTNQAGVVFANGTGFSTSSTRVGWTIGYGTEFDLGKNWSAKAEYDYISFGSHTALASDGTTVMRDRADISQVKVGLNYRFGPTAVIAKY